MSPFWSVPEPWLGETCFIIGGGPSLINADYSPIRDRNVIGTNHAHTLGQWVDFTFFGDYRWWKWQMEGKGTRTALERYRGTMVTAVNDAAALLRGTGVKVLKRRGGAGVRVDMKDTVCWNLSSGACAINLAALLGARKIVLLGFDMRHVPGAPGLGHNWHDGHIARHTPRNDVYDRFLKPFPGIGKDLRELGIECVNASLDSAIEEFEKVGLDEGMRIQ